MDGSDIGLKANPLSYRACYLGDVAPPPIGVKPISEAMLAENPCIVLEGQDIVKAIEDGMLAEKAKGLDPLSLPAKTFDDYANDPENGVVRYHMHLKDARMLCCHLVYALAQSDDRIATRLAEVLDEMYEQGPTMGFEEREDG